VVVGLVTSIEMQRPFETSKIFVRTSRVPFVFPQGYTRRLHREKKKIKEK
jgi:hypothetical protein